VSSQSPLMGATLGAVEGQQWCKLEQRWQGRAMGKSQKASVLLREDPLSGAWTQNTKHEKKEIPLRQNPRNRGTTC